MASFVTVISGLLIMPCNMQGLAEVTSISRDVSTPVKHVTSMTKKDFDNLSKKLEKGASFAVEKENVDEMTYGLMASSDIVDKVRTVPVEEGTLVIVPEDVEIINNVSTSQVDAMKTLGIRCGEVL